jgi:hypothetical protein
MSKQTRGLFWFGTIIASGYPLCLLAETAWPPASDAWLKEIER